MEIKIITVSDSLHVNNDSNVVLKVYSEAGSNERYDKALREYVREEIAKSGTFKQEVVPSLSSVTNPNPTTLYQVPITGGEGNQRFDEYFYAPEHGTQGDPDYIPAHFEKVGSTDYTPDHEIANNTTLGKLVLTVMENGVPKQYAIEREPIEKPENPPTITAGENFDNSKSISMSAGSGEIIRYSMTTDGSTPTTPTATTGTVYTGDFNIGNQTAYQTTYKIVAVAVKNGQVSDPCAVQTYVCTRKLSAPTVGDASGNANSSSRKVILSGTAGTTINYTIRQGSDTTTGSVAASAAESARTLTLSTKGTWAVIAYASQSGWADSDEASKTGIVVKQIATPSVSGSNNQYWAQRTLTISCDTSDVTLYYRYSSSGEWTQYNASSKPVIDATKTVYVKAEKTGWTSANNGNGTSVTVGAAHTHYGLSARTTADATTFAALTSEVKAGAPTGMYTFTSDGTPMYMWIFVPASQAAVTQIKNANNMNQIDAWTSGTATINGVSYRWYRTNSTTSQTSKWAINQDWSNN